MEYRLTRYCGLFVVPRTIFRRFKNNTTTKSERAMVDDLRGMPMMVGTLEEMIDDNHAIVSTAMGPEYYVNVMSFVNQDLLEPGSTILLHNKVTTSFGRNIF
jgi:ATP-dependent 26S proteasome regulatory subunit